MSLRTILFLYSSTLRHRWAFLQGLYNAGGIVSQNHINLKCSVSKGPMPDLLKLGSEIFKFCCSLGNGRCDDTYNTESCLYDYGDCCTPAGNKIMLMKYMSLTFDRSCTLYRVHHIEMDETK